MQQEAKVRKISVLPVPSCELNSLQYVHFENNRKKGKDGDRGSIRKKRTSGSDWNGDLSDLKLPSWISRSKRNVHELGFRLADSQPDR